MTRAFLRRGTVAWGSLDPVEGREQGGRRPLLVVASDTYLATVTTLCLVLPVTSVDRGWPNHVFLRGDVDLATASWAMTEQPRTVSRGRLHEVLGGVDEETLTEVDVYLRDFFALR